MAIMSNISRRSVFTDGPGRRRQLRRPSSRSATANCCTHPPSPPAARPLEPTVPADHGHGARSCRRRAQRRHHQLGPSPGRRTEPAVTSGDRPATGQRRRDRDGRRRGTGSLAQAVAARPAAVRVVAVGNATAQAGVRRRDSDSAMVLGRLIPMLGSQSLWTTSRVAFSDGRWVACGALAAGRRSAQAAAHRGDRGGQPIALWLSSVPPRQGPSTAPDFAANSVFGLPALAQIPIIDIGTSDPFTTRRRSSSQLPNRRRAASPAVTTPASGVHKLPAELTWLAPLLTSIQ